MSAPVSTSPSPTANVAPNAGGRPATGGLVHRRRRTVPAIVCALVLLAVAVGAGLAAVTGLVSGRAPVALDRAVRWAAATPWSSVWVLLVAIGVALLGLWLVVLGIKPGPVNAVPLAVAGRPGVRAGATVMTRTSIARLASATAETIDGVDRVRSSVSRRSVRLTVHTTLRETSALRDSVGSGVRNRLESSGIRPAPRVRVAVRTTGES